MNSLIKILNIVHYRLGPHVFVSLLLLFAFAGVSGQTKGRVIDAETREPLAYVNIVTTKGSLIAVSNQAGRFFIDSAYYGSPLIARLLGYQNDTITIDRNDFMINLKPNSFKLSEVVVSAPVLPGKLTRTPGSISLITSDRLERNTNTEITDELDQVPGVFVQSGAYNTKRITIRGIGSRTPYSTNRIKAYLNNVPLTSGSGVTSIEDIDIHNLGRVEIMKGPSSTLYGSGLGGSIVFYPDYAGKRGFDANLHSKTGSFGLDHHSANISYKKINRFSVSNTYSYMQSNGFRQNSHYKRHNYFLTGEINIFDSELEALFLYQDVFSRIPSSLSQEDFMNNPGHAASNWLKIKGFEEYNKLLSGFTYTTSFSSNIILESSVYGKTYQGYESRPFNILDDNAYSFGTRNKITLSSNNGLKTILGFERYYEIFKWKIFETNEGIEGPLSNQNKETRQYLNLFGLIEYRPSEKLTIHGGVNQNYLNYKLDDNFPSDSVDNTGNYSYSPIFSPRIGVTYSANQQLNLYTAAGHGFSAPSVEEALLPEGDINPDLKPEQGYNVEIGAKGKILDQKLYYDLSYYWIFMNNLLVTKRLAEDIFTGINAGETFHQGLEALLDYNLLSRLPGNNRELSLNLSYTISENKFIDFIDDGIDHSGNHLPGIPNQRASGNLYWKHHMGLFSGLTYQYTGKQYMNDENSKKYGNYSVLNWQIGFKSDVLRWVDVNLYVKINNIFDKEYASMILVNAPSFGGSAPRYYYPGRPRSFVLGLKLMP